MQAENDMVPSDELLDHRNVRKNHWDKSVRDLSHQLRADLSSILPVELWEMVKFGLDFGNFQFFPTSFFCRKRITLPSLDFMILGRKTFIRFNKYIFIFSCLNISDFFSSMPSWIFLAT